MSSPVRGVSGTPTLENNNTALTLTVPSSSPYQPLNSIIDATFSDANNSATYFDDVIIRPSSAFGSSTKPSLARGARDLQAAPRVSRFHGFSAIVLVLMTLAIIVLAVKAGSVITGIGQRFTGAQGTMTRIQQSLVQYVATCVGELPCPANPAATALHPGYPDDNQTVPTPTTTCLYPGGVVPWKALGLTVNDVTDPWGRLISCPGFRWHDWTYPKQWRIQGELRYQQY